MLQGSQVFSARLSSLWISLGLERYLLPFGQSMKARTLDCTDVNKYVGPTIVRLNKTEAFLTVEPLYPFLANIDTRTISERRWAMGDTATLLEKQRGGGARYEPWAAK